METLSNEQQQQRSSSSSPPPQPPLFENIDVNEQDNEIFESAVQQQQQPLSPNQSLLDDNDIDDYDDDDDDIHHHHHQHHKHNSNFIDNKDNIENNSFNQRPVIVPESNTVTTVVDENNTKQKVISPVNEMANRKFKLPSTTGSPSPAVAAPMEEIATHDNKNGHTDGQFIEVIVSEPQKIGEGMGSYIAYKVTTKTNILKFKQTHFYSLRRFSDFLGLHDLLVAKYLRSGRIIPPAPEKNLIGSTKVKMGSGGVNQQSTEPGSTTGVGMEWVENRRAALERFLIRITQHPILCTDVDFINFLESDVELPRAVNTSTLSSAGVRRLFNKMGETVNKITYKMDENDPWFEDKMIEIEKLDNHMQKLNSAIKALVIYRKDLAGFTGNVAKSAALLSTCEEHTGLSRALSQLADVEEKVELLRSEQANSDMYILAETLKDYIGLFGSIKDVFHERVKVFQNWEHAQLQLTRRRENKVKLELTIRNGNNDKYDQAQREVEEWESKVQRCQKEFDEISAEIKKEMERFEIARAHDFKITILKYLEDQMAHQQQLIKYWEQFLVSAKEII